MNTHSLHPLLGSSDDLNFVLSLINSVVASLQGGKSTNKKIDQFVMLERAADIIEFRREITDEVETSINDAAKEACQSKKDGNKPKRNNGHKIAQIWYADFDTRIKDANGYLVDSKLREAYENTPPDQRNAFLDSIGGYFVTYKTSGEPIPTFLVCEKELHLQKLPPEEQDDYFNQMEASNE